METTWKITNLKRKPDNNLVIEVGYFITFKLEDEINRRFGRVTLEGDVNSPDFVAYEELTEELVIGWVKSKLGAERISALSSEMQEELQSIIYKKNNPEFLEENPFRNRNI